MFTLMLWIVAMFGVASYLIAVEYADYELQKKLEHHPNGAGEPGRAAGAADVQPAPYAPAARPAAPAGTAEEPRPYRRQRESPPCRATETKAAAPAGEAEAAWTAERIHR